jgi:glucose-6-phosphate dehydrogenase assembly protein OpcA
MVSRVSTATVVAVASPRTRDGIVETLAALATGGVRPIFITLGDGVEVRRHDSDGVTIIDGLLPQYLDNAVAALRLSSLPTLAWWRAELPDLLGELARLVDRVVLDVEDPAAVWPQIPSLVPHTSMSDMRWARLTRWRDLIAQFFDLPEVRAAAGSFDRVELQGADRHQMRLLGGWLATRLPAKDRVTVKTGHADGLAIGAVRIVGAEGALGVRLLRGRSCLETEVQMTAGHTARRVVPAGDDRAEVLLGEELRVRSREPAFEDAVQAAERL